MQGDEQARGVAAITKLVTERGFEVLALTVSLDRHVLLTLDADPGPVVMVDCVRMNHAVRDALTEAGLPADDYAVDVQSPGTRRPLHTLRHFERFIGERARVKLTQETPDGQRVLLGTIHSIAEDQVVLIPDLGSPWRLRLAEIKEARLDPKYS